MNSQSRLALRQASAIFMVALPAALAWEFRYYILGAALGAAALYLAFRILNALPSWVWQVCGLVIILRMFAHII